jgi:hypothetical protein
VNFVKSQQTDTDGGINRVFEVFSPQNDTGKIDQIEAERMLQDLELHHGVVGLEYAKLLGADPDAADRFTLSLLNSFAAEVKSGMEDRYWLAACGTILAGAHYANQMGAQIDIDVLRAYLVENFHRNRDARVESKQVITSPDYAEEKLTNFLGDSGRFTIWTDTHVIERGRPKLVNILHAPDLTSKGEKVTVQWVVEDQLLKISRQAVYDYFKPRDIPADQIIDGWKNTFKAKVNARGSIASGTQFRRLRETTVEIFVDKTSQLWPLLNTYSPQETAEKALAFQSPAPAGQTDVLASAMQTAASDLELARKHASDATP